MVASSTDDECPGWAATVEAWSCAACGLDWADTAVHPALSIIGLLPTPELRTAAFLATLRTEVARRLVNGAPRAHGPSLAVKTNCG